MIRYINNGHGLRPLRCCLCSVGMKDSFKTLKIGELIKQTYCAKETILVDLNICPDCFNDRIAPFIDALKIGGWSK